MVFVRQMILAAAVLLCGCASAPAPSQSASTLAPPDMTIPTDVRRTTIVVQDIDRSLVLYRDALGLKINYDQTLTLSGPAFARGQPGRKARLVLLQGKDNWIGWIGLLQYTDPPIAPPPGPAPTQLGIGSHVLVMAVQDAATACAKAESAPGVRIVVPAKVTEYPGRGADAPPIRIIGCQLWDADGAYLELNQALR